MQQLKINRFGMINKKYDAIIVLSGGLEKSGSPNEWTKRRLEKALSLFTGKEYIIPSSRQTAHKQTLLDNFGFSIDEAVADARYLIRRGVPAWQILQESCSFDTIGNAYFVRVVHCEPRKLLKLCIITSEFHMPRAKAVFNWVFRLSPVKFRYNLTFIAASDEHIDSETLKASKRKEKAGLQKLKRTKKGIKNMYQFHQWLFHKHKAYAAGIRPIKSKGKLSEKCLKSY